MRNLLLPLLATASLSGIASGQVLPLQFTDGNGNTSVDQFVGTAGSGWATAWGQQAGSVAAPVVNTVTNTNPFGSGGNYFSQTLSVADESGGGQARRGISRQYNGVPLTGTLQYSFDFRIDSGTGFDNQYNDAIYLYESTGANLSSPGSNTVSTWRFAFTGVGTITVPGISGSAGTWEYDTDYHFNIVSDAVTETYSFTITDLSDSSIVASGSDIAWWNAATANNTHGGWVNLVGGIGIGVGQSGNTVTWSMDNYTIAIPEPTGGVMLLGALGLLALGRRRAQR